MRTVAIVSQKGGAGKTTLLDVLASRDFDVPGAAAQLRSTRSQLVKLLRELPPAFARVNAERAARGLPALR